MDAGAGIEPGCRHDDGVDKRPLDAVKDRRFVPFVDDAHWHQQHAGADVERRLEEHIDVRLFELQFACVLEPFDERMLEFELADETKTIREAVAENQDEAVKVEIASPSARSSGALTCISM